MFYAARSGKQHLAFECLENRHLLSADFGAVDFHDDLAKQSPAPVVITMAPTAQTAGQVEPFEEFKGKATASYGDHHPQHLTTHFDIFESDGLEGDDVGQDDLESRLEQTPILSLMTIQLAQISHSEIQSLNAPSLIIELGVFKVTPAQQVSIDYAQNDSDAGEVDEIEIDNIF